MKFSDKVKKFSKSSIDMSKNVFRASAIQLFSNVIAETPVDTGRLRGNWQASVSSPITSEIERKTDPTPAMVSAIVPSDGIKPLYMTNNLPYVQYIEEGSSAKAPNGMVRKNVAKWQRIVSIVSRKYKI